MRVLRPFNDLEMKVYHSLFLDFSILGGMPAVVAEYIKKNTFWFTSWELTKKS